MDSVEELDRPLVVVNDVDRVEESSHYQNGQYHERRSSSSSSSIADDDIFADFDGSHQNINTELYQPPSPDLRPDNWRHTTLQPDTGISAEEVQEIALSKFKEPHLYHMDYPHALPKWLDFPPKLSTRLPPEELARRRAEVLARGQDSRIPQHLRAALFFDQSDNNPQYQIDSGGRPATEVLNEVLEWAIESPVTIFMEQEWVAGAGGVFDVDLHQKDVPNKKSFFKRGSRAVLDFVGVHSRSNSGEKPNGMTIEEESDSEGIQTPRQAQEFSMFNAGGAPNTLVAELQLRKQHQRSRNRQGLDAQLDGSRHTLLEMDAVAEREKEERKKGKTMLSWELGHRAEDDDDDDVPLGVLFPDQRRNRGSNSRMSNSRTSTPGLSHSGPFQPGPGHPGLSRQRPSDPRLSDSRPVNPLPFGPGPMGRETYNPNPVLPPGMTMEQYRNAYEPLGLRRDRLREEAKAKKEAEEAKKADRFGLKIQGVNNTSPVIPDLGPDETLASRARRLKAAKAQQQKRISQDFSKEMLDQFGSKKS